MGSLQRPCRFFLRFINEFRFSYSTLFTAHAHARKVGKRLHNKVTGSTTPIAPWNFSCLFRALPRIGSDVLFLFILPHHDFRATVNNGIFQNDFPDGIGYDFARFRVFHADDVAFHRRVHVAVFERQIAIFRSAVDQQQPLAIAKRLRADDFAAHEREIFGLPAEVFAFDNAVFHGNVFRVPERVLGIENAFRKSGFANVLKRIFPLKLQAVHREIAA